jgi:hypothetical protein
MYLFILSACFTEFPERDFPPVITILSPSEEYRDQIDNPYNVGSFIPFEFLVVDPDSKLNIVTVVLSSNIDGTLYQGVPNADGNLSILLATLSAGEHQISISAEDDQNYISETFGIALNTPPPAPILTMLPEYPTTEDDLYVDILLVDDLDGDDVSFNVEWLRGGIIQPEEDSIYLPSDLTNKEERWYVRVTPSDSFGEGESISTSVINSPQYRSAPKKSTMINPFFVRVKSVISMGIPLRFRTDGSYSPMGLLLISMKAVSYCWEDQMKSLQMIGSIVM